MWPIGPLVHHINKKELLKLIEKIDPSIKCIGEVLAELQHFEFHKKNVKKMLIQQFWRIFQVKHLGNDSSS